MQATGLVPCQKEGSPWSMCASQTNYAPAREQAVLVGAAKYYCSGWQCILEGGYKVVLAADQVLIYSAGHRGFRIDLSLSQEMVP